MIIRVFPTKTSQSPNDNYCYFGMPPFNLPPHDAVHISVIFTWDIERAMELKRQWEVATDKPVLIGGPAFGDRGESFESGMYVKHGITFTSRGCNNNCPWCFVPRREGKLRELPITPGNIIQDNNFLQCSPGHLHKVFDMLTRQRGIEFKGGLEARLITPEIVEQFRWLSIKELWLAFDAEGNRAAVERATDLLRPYFNRNKLRCYILMGFAGDTFKNAENRTRIAYDYGMLPQAMVYRDDRNECDKRWRDFSRRFARPAITKAIFSTGASENDIISIART